MEAGKSVLVVIFSVFISEVLRTNLVPNTLVTYLPVRHLGLDNIQCLIVIIYYIPRSHYFVSVCMVYTGGFFPLRQPLHMPPVLMYEKRPGLDDWWKMPGLNDSCLRHGHHWRIATNGYSSQLFQSTLLFA